MENIKKLANSVDQLRVAVEKMLASDDLTEINSLNAQIGATFHSIQYGTGVAAISVKKAYDTHKAEVRSGAFAKPEVVVTENYATVIEEPTEKPKKKILKKKISRKKK